MSTVTCTSCHCETTVEPSWKYCTKCGSRLTTDSSIGAPATATRPAPTIGSRSSEGIRRVPASGPADGSTSARPKPGKVYIFFVALAFCVAGAVCGALVGLFLNVKGAEAATTGIAAGGGVAYAYLQRRGASHPRSEPEATHENYSRFDYLVGNRLYCVAAEPRGAKLDRDIARSIFESFTLLEGNAPVPTAMPAPSAAPSGVPAPPTIQATNEEVRVYPNRIPTPSAAPAASTEQTKMSDHRYVNPSGRYLINFPGSPKESKPAVSNRRVVHQALLELRSVVYVVRYVDLPASELDRAQALLDALAAFYSRSKDEVIGEGHGKLKHENRVWVAGRTAYESNWSCRTEHT